VKCNALVVDAISDRPCSGSTSRRRWGRWSSAPKEERAAALGLMSLATCLGGGRGDHPPMRRAPDRIGIAQIVDPQVATDAEHALERHGERVVEPRDRAGAITRSSRRAVHSD